MVCMYADTLLRGYTHTCVHVSTCICRQSGCRCVCLLEDPCVGGMCLVIECVTAQVYKDVGMECT